MNRTLIGLLGTLLLIGVANALYEKRGTIGSYLMLDVKKSKHTR